MFKKLMTTAAAASMALATLAVPATADARDHRGHGYRGHYQNYNHGHRHRDNNGDALAAGVVGLAIGAVLGAALSSDPEPRYGPPPQAYYPPPPPPQPYYGSGYGAPYYGNQGQCVRRELQWDPSTRRNVEVSIPFPC